MKHLHILFSLLALPFASIGQEGLEGVYVETYYIVDDADTRDTLHTGYLQKGAVTYRIYLDLAPGYSFQAAYGTPETPLIIRSSEKIYNHIESGQPKANIVPLRSMKKNTLLLDSWLTAGAAGENHLGVPKCLDTDGVDSTLTLPKEFLNNASKKLIGVKTADGLLTVDSVPFAQFFQIQDAEKALGSAINSKEIKITNGAWACLGKGATGADPMGDNYVLIAQITTSGTLEYQLNLMIGAPNGRSIKYSYKPNDPAILNHPALTGVAKRSNNYALKKHLQRKKKKQQPSV